MKGWYRRRCVIPLPILASIIRYDEVTGHLYWIQKRRGRRIGVPVGCVTKNGDRIIGFGIGTMLAQEVVWALKTDRECFSPIRHRNGNKDDNRFENLYEDSTDEDFV